MRLVPAAPQKPRQEKIVSMSELPRLSICWRCAAVAAACLVLLVSRATAESVRARCQEGVTHGFLVVREPHGKIIATGDMLQRTDGKKEKQFYSQLIFHFYDGSLYSDTTVYEERGTFKLISDHLIEKGPSFKEQSERWIDVRTGEFKARTIDEHGKSKYVQKKMKYPDDVMNGMVYLVVKNIVPTAKSSTVSMVVGSPTPRTVKLVITPRAHGTFLVGGSKREELHYVIHIDITGVAGVVAPLRPSSWPARNGPASVTAMVTNRRQAAASCRTLTFSRPH